MAHFAKIEDGIVRQIIVVNNEILLDEDGLENESFGVAFCQSLFGSNTQWVQTSYNVKFRGRYAAIGDKWDAENDVFVSLETEIPTP